MSGTTSAKKQVSKSPMSPTKQTMNGAQKVVLPAGVQETLRANMVANVGHLVFRRVKGIEACEMDITNVYIHHVEVVKDGLGVEITKDVVDAAEYIMGNQVPPAESTEVRYSKFSVTTSEDPVRCNDGYSGRAFIVDQSTMCEASLLHPGGMRRPQLSIYEPHSREFGRDYEPPDFDSMVALVIEEESCGPVVKAWAPVSERFFHMWSYLVYASHPSFDSGKGRGEKKTPEHCKCKRCSSRPGRRGGRACLGSKRRDPVQLWSPGCEGRHLLGLCCNCKEAKEERIRRKAMGARVLSCNNFRRWATAMVRNGYDFRDCHDIQAKYTAHNYEWDAINYCHIYNAIYVMAVLGEMPTEANIPVRAAGPNLKEWNLPFGGAKGFASTLLHLFAPLQYPYEHHFPPLSKTLLPKSTVSLLSK